MSRMIASPRIPAAWLEIIQNQDLALLSELPDSELPIPRSFVEKAAFFRFLKEGRLHGRHLEHWIAAERDLQIRFRRYIDAYCREFGTDVASLDGLGSRTTANLPKSHRKGGCDDASFRGSLPDVVKIDTMGQVGNMGSMGRKGRIVDGCPDSPQVQRVVEQLSHRREAANADRQPCSGQLAAVLIETGCLIATARNLEDLVEKVEQSPHAGKDWRVKSVVGSNAGITIDELMESLSPQD